MKKNCAYVVSLIALALALVMPAGQVLAAPVNVFPGGACQGNTRVCGNAGSTNPIFNIVKNVINILLYATGIIAVIMIIIGSIGYVLSGGEQSKITGAKNTILYAVIGMIVAVMAFAIVNFVVARLF